MTNRLMTWPDISRFQQNYQWTWKAVIWSNWIKLTWLKKWDFSLQDCSTWGFLLHAFEQHTPSHYSVQHLLCDAQVPLGNGNGWVWISGFDTWLSRLEKCNRCRAECRKDMKMHQLCWTKQGQESRSCSQELSSGMQMLQIRQLQWWLRWSSMVFDP